MTKTKTVHVVENNEYWGEIGKWQREVPDSATAEEIWTIISGDEESPNTEASTNYLEAWTAYGPHHKGVITQIWWGEGAEEKANARYTEIQATK